MQTENKPINPDIYKHYNAGLRKGVDNVFFEDSNDGLSDRLRANVSRFAAYKAHHVTKALKGILNDDEIPVKERKNQAKKALKIFANRQKTEQATATMRARTAKQFSEFMNPEDLELFPNLRWLSSSAVNPRADHIVFYNQIWAKTDPFWMSNSPGQEWNCQCDVEETSEPVTNNTGIQTPVPPRGLEGNPAFTGEIFTDNASYISKSGKTKEERDIVESYVLKTVRKENLAWAKKNLQGKTVKHPQLDREIHFSGRGINEYLNQPHDDYYVKNETIRRIKELLPSLKLINKTKHKGKDTYVFEIIIAGKTNYILCNEYNGRDVMFYSITDSRNVLK